MSDATFSRNLTAFAPAAAAPGRKSLVWLRTAALRVRRAKDIAIDLNDTYGVVEGVCLFVAAGFGSAVLAMAFGVRV